MAGERAKCPACGGDHSDADALLVMLQPWRPCVEHLAAQIRALAPAPPQAEPAPEMVRCSRDCDHPRPCPIHDRPPTRADHIGAQPWWPAPEAKGAACPECHGIGVVLQYPTTEQVPCSACDGTGRADEWQRRAETAAQLKGKR